MKDEDLKQELQSALQSMQAVEPPPFDTVWAKARSAHQRARRIYATIAGAAAAAAAVAIVVWPVQHEPDNGFLNEQAFLNSTRWTAPSDVLMSGLDWGVYQDIPRLIESTELQEGTLL